ncbi:hemerythrin domain-containing protein [Blastococcus xanthinilyticus]|uniref:Hemerythrin HHE cation binding domain-containing protein n=1 Tax=Blastococcus xanthinilyticus TaxID=1564164 RepID=A0A5S5CQM3_9ACTN|nr:hemerythrin domain-containing protein [Blastococcus xanthinilyticus]TYP82917.1 hemerythrin HHE cation binding domain-containing protein [Blastococcus xanthinilyticus]
MTAVAVRSPAVPTPRLPADRLAPPAPAPAPPSPGRPAAYQQVLHQLVRRELRTLADVATWAPDGECARTGLLTCHAGLVTRVLLHHHAVERDALWPALLRRVPAAERPAAEAAVAAWTDACAGIDAALRDLDTTARQWTVAGSGRARSAFALACRRVADAVDAQTAEEERTLLPLLDAHLPDADWAAVVRTARCGLSARQRLLVLGLALEDCCAGERTRVLHGLPRGTRLAWRLRGGGRYRAAVVRLRGAPPAR